MGKFSLMEEQERLQAEKELRAFWHSSGIYKWSFNESENFVIDTPPPTISGRLHMGHVLSYCHADFIARFQRMLGKSVYYPMGFDNNGLPTERLVEKTFGIRASEIGREAFAQKCRELIEEEVPKFRELFEQIGLSIDWSLSYQTASKEVCALSQLSFIELFKIGQIYNAEQAVFWDPVDCTTISHSEIEEREKSSIENVLLFLVDGVHVPVATTRPELLPGCVALLCHPSDSRQLIGKHAITPIFGVKVPILADEEVNPAKGTGVVMCCTFGDMLDVTWWKKHNLPLRQVLNEKGHVVNVNFDGISCDLASARVCMNSITGLFVLKARAKILEDLRSRGLLASQREIKNTVKCAERSGAELEIRLSKQWFVRSVAHKQALLDMSNQLNWHPSSMKARLDSWIENLSSDWCISRQRFFGVPIPVWYSKADGSIILPHAKDLPVNPALHLPSGFSSHEVIPDLDVMDTWATSSLTPQINAGGISAEAEERYSKLFPADLRPQGHEIIRSWAFSTILKSYLHSSQLPWKNIMISGWCLASDKEKMSKSKNNALFPEKLLLEFGPDAMRYWSSTAKLGANTVLSVDTLKEGKRLVTKLSNAAKFCFQHVEELVQESLDYNDVKGEIVCQADLWMLSCLNAAIKSSTASFEEYNYSAARAAAVQCLWYELCDRYIELVRGRLSTCGCEARSAKLALYFSIRTILKLFAPFLPYAAERLFAYFTKDSVSIHSMHSWPKPIFDESSSAQGALKILSMAHKLKQGFARSAIDLCISTDVHIAEDLLCDLKSATFAKNLTVQKGPPEGEWLKEEGEVFSVYVRFLQS